ncbi:MAG: hypothetical protein ABEK12_00630, partial [Candidatus Nanohaloarchaea archaeon]
MSAGEAPVLGNIYMPASETPAHGDGHSIHEWGKLRKTDHPTEVKHINQHKSLLMFGAVLTLVVGMSTSAVALTANATESPS